MAHRGLPAARSGRSSPPRCPSLPTHPPARTAGSRRCATRRPPRPPPPPILLCRRSPSPSSWRVRERIHNPVPVCPAGGQRRRRLNRPWLAWPVRSRAATSAAVATAAWPPDATILRDFQTSPVATRQQRGRCEQVGHLTPPWGVWASTRLYLSRRQPPPPGGNLPAAAVTIPRRRPRVPLGDIPSAESTLRGGHPSPCGGHLLLGPVLPSPHYHLAGTPPMRQSAPSLAPLVRLGPAACTSRHRARMCSQDRWAPCT